MVDREKPNAYLWEASFLGKGIEARYYISFDCIMTTTLLEGSSRSSNR
jgi:hypothetical protein